MLNEMMILDQKQSPGLIENPCRDALIDLASKVPADQKIVELGSFKGRSTAHLALGSHRGNRAEVHAFDPFEDAPEIDPNYLTTAPTVREYREPTTRETFENHMKVTGAQAYVTAHQQTATDGAKSWKGQNVGLLFHDALHDYDSVFEDLKAWLPKMAKNAVVVLHDVGDPQYQVLNAATAAFTRTKTIASRWAWESRSIHLWAKNPQKRGFVVVRTK